MRLFDLPAEIIHLIFRLAIYDTRDFVALAASNQLCFVTAVQEFLYFANTILTIVESSDVYILPRSLDLRLINGSERLKRKTWQIKALLPDNIQFKMEMIFSKVNNLVKRRFEAQIERYLEENF